MPMPKRPLTDHEQDALSTLAEHMGNPMDENDIDIGRHIDRLVHEKNYAKMRAAQTGGASEDQPLAPPQIQQQAVKGREAGLQNAAGQGALQAAQAQAAQDQGAAPAPQDQPMPPAPRKAPPQAPGPQAGPPPGAPGEAEQQQPDSSQQEPTED